MTPLERATQALSESLTGIPLNGDLPTFAVVAVLKAIRPGDNMGAFKESAVRQWIDSILGDYA